MATGFNQLLKTMAQQDFFTGVLPFVLSFTVYYILLKNVPFIKDSDDTDRFAGIISIVFAFFTARFIVLNPFYKTFFVTFFGKLTVGVIGILGLLTILALIMPDLKSKLPVPALVVVAIAISGAAFTSSGGFGPPLFRTNLASLDSIIGMLLDTGLIWIIVVAGVLWWVTSDGSDNRTYGMPYWFGMTPPNQDDEGDPP